jgi:hypothetical protein
MVDIDCMIAPDPRRRIGVAPLVALLLAPVALIGSLAFLATDIHVPIQGFGQTADSFCGSAYDVSFIKRDGYMGGEYPPNQDEIDSACVSKSNRYAYPGAALGLLVPTLIAGALLNVRQTRTTQERLGASSE